MAPKRSQGHRQAIAVAIQSSLDYGVLVLYSGPQPTDANQAETGTQLAIITNNGLTFVAGVTTNGLRFDTPVAGVLNIMSTQTWKTLACLATGNVGWARYYATAWTTGSSTTAVRRDFSVGTSGADINLTSTLVGVGLPFNITQFTISVVDQ